MHLYSCSGDGSVLEHRPNQPLQDAINVNGLIQSTNGSKHKLMSCTDVSWNCNGSMLAIGNHDGTIEVFVPPSLKRVCTVSVHKKSITFLAWHPGYGDDSNDGKMTGCVVLTCKTYTNGSCFILGEGRLTYRLASGSNETTIHIHDLSSVLRSCDSASENLSTITSSHRKLVGHCGRITSLCWSPHHCDMLVSASYDGTAQVWDVETNQTLANFRGHVGRLLSVQWSYLDAHVVYSGGEDGSVRPWSISGQKYTQPPATVGSKTSKPKKKSKSKTKETPEAKTSQNDEETTLDIVVQQTGTRSEGIPDDISRNTEVSTDAENKVESWRQPDSKLSWRSPETTMIAGSPSPINAHAQNSDEPQENDTVAIVTGDDEDTHSISSLSTQEPGPTIIVSKSKGEATKKKRKFKSMFPLSAVADNNTRVNVQQDCIELAQYLAASHPGNASAIHAESSIPGESSSVNLGFFADRSSAYKMFEAEDLSTGQGRHHSSANNLDYQLQLEVWKGNLGGALQMAIEAKQLSDWLVATSALAGHDVWLHTAESYADQLKSEGAHQRAVLYYLVCHKVYLAIDVFKKQSMFRRELNKTNVNNIILFEREAIALAKVRLSPSDPVLHDLYCSWARKLEIEHYESAAKCYLAAGLPADAVRVLSVRGDQASLTTALKVSVVSGMHQLSSSLAVRVMHICMGTGNWYAADEALALCTGVEGHVSALYAHEIFVSELLQEGLMSNDEFKEQCHSKIFTSLKKGEKQSIIESCLETASLQESPWLMDAPPSDWVISHILKAWDRAGILNGSLLQSTLQQLSSYSHSNLNENLSIKQILTRISYDISLGLLCGVRQDLYSCSLPWLQTLESCIKSGYFVLAQILCVRLLPRGAQSLDDISVLRRALNDSTEPRVTKEHEVSNDKLFSYFNGFYNLLMLYNIWWRDPMILPRFRANNECKDITTITENISRENSAVQHVALNVAERIAQEIATIDNCTLVESAQGQEVPADVTSTAEDETSNEQKEPLSANSYSTEVIAVNPSNTPLDMYTVLRSIQESLLSENVGICAALKKQLLEVKKEVILLRSRRILDSVAAASSAKQKRTSKKKSKVNQASKGVAEGLESNKITSPLVESSESSDVCEVSENVGDHAEAACCDTTQVNVSTETSLLPSIEPLDVRYKLGVWTLELMQEEEQRLQEELSKQPLKDFPFPVPTESAMVIGYVCSKANTYPCHEPAVLYKLGLEGVTSALEHAQWDLERKILKQIEKRLLEVNTSGRREHQTSFEHQLRFWLVKGDVLG
ncbi:hypothetical protein QZH41_017892 [Actinostola sp. cb2023]|nr:hypothetical protein QZH41_017892 [Actinostola sp. cb2023]